MNETDDFDRRSRVAARPPSARRVMLLGAALLAVAQSGHAQTQDGRATNDQMLRSDLAVERSRADALLQRRRWECSQRFFVTSCMDDARAEHREVVEALDQREAEIDHRLRQERAQSRLAIIQQKTDALARLAPLPVAEPAALPPAPARVELAPQPGPAAGVDREQSQAASESAARERAEAAQRRRAAAERRRIEREKAGAGQQKPAMPLPDRPTIPPVSN